MVLDKIKNYKDFKMKINFKSIYKIYLLLLIKYRTLIKLKLFKIKKSLKLYKNKIDNFFFFFYLVKIVDDVLYNFTL
jgi:hypothetical protein